MKPVFFPFASLLGAVFLLIVAQPIRAFSPDQFEPNETRETANPTAPVGTVGVLPILNLHTGTDHDWSRWETAAATAAGNYVALYFDSPASDLALEVWRLVGTSWQLHASSNTSTSHRKVEAVHMAGWPAGQYAVHVFSPTGSTDSYELGFGVPPPVDAVDLTSRNDSHGTALSLGSIALYSGAWLTAGLSIDSASDEDWFSFTLDFKPSSDSRFWIEMDGADGDIDLYLWRWTGTALEPTPIASSAGTGNTETVLLNPSLAPGTYLIQVVGYNGATSPGYTLHWDLPVPPDSPYESGTGNNSFAAPTDLGTRLGFSRIDALSLHSNDIDYYRFTTDPSQPMGASHSIVLDTDFTHSPISVVLFDAAGRFVAVAARGVDYTIPLQGLPPGSYVLEVYSSLGAEVRTYALNFNLPGASSIAPDRFESPNSNNAPTSPTDLTSRHGLFQANGLSVGPHVPSTDVDWFKIRLKSPGLRGHYVAIDFQHSAGDLDLELYNASGSTLLASSRSSRNRESLSLEGHAADFYLVKVLGYSNATNPRYDLTLNLAGSDIYEGDSILDLFASDTKPKAVALPSAGVPVGNYRRWSNLSLQPADDDWYKIILNSAPTTNDYVEIRFDHTEGDLGLEIQHGSQAPLKSESLGDTERISLADLTFDPAHHVYIRVFGYNGRGNPAYELIVDAPGYLNGDWADAASNNGSPATPTVLTPPGQATATGPRTWDDPANPLSISPTGDVDWYRFTTGDLGKEGDYAAIAFDHTLGDIDLQLYDSAGTTMLAASDGVSHAHRVSLEDRPAGTYLLRVAGYNGATNPTYSLEISAPWVAVTTDVFESQLGSNDTRLTATPLGTITGEWSRSGLSLRTAADEDWYQFILPAAGDTASRVRIDYDWWVGDLDLELYDNTGTRLRQSDSFFTNWETISLSGRQPGAYYARVFGARNRAYSLRIVTAPGSGDWAEQGTPNNTRLQARDLRVVKGAQQWESLSIHAAGNDDWFKFTTVGAAVAGDQVTISFDHAHGNLDMELLDANGNPFNPPLKSESLANVETLALSQANGGAPDTYYLRVYGYAGAVNPTYLLSVGAPDGFTGGDWAEGSSGNAGLTNASALGVVSGDRAWSGFSIHQPGDEDWYSFDLGAAGVEGHDIALLHDRTLGNLHLQLRNASGTVLETSASDADRQQVSLAGQPTGRYFLRVYGSLGSVTNPDYSLVATAPIGLKADWAERLGGNETQGTATDLRRPRENLLVSTLSLHSAADQDWFMFVLDRAPISSQAVRIDFNHHEGDLSLRVIAPNGAIVDSQSGVNDFEEVSLNGLGAGTYHVRVTGTVGNPTYALLITFARALTKDRLEVNNSAATAFRIEHVGGRFDLTNYGYAGHVYRNSGFTGFGNNGLAPNLTHSLPALSGFGGNHIYAGDQLAQLSNRFASYTPSGLPGVGGPFLLAGIPGFAEAAAPYQPAQQPATPTYSSLQQQQLQLAQQAQQIASVDLQIKQAERKIAEDRKKREQNDLFALFAFAHSLKQPTTKPRWKLGKSEAQTALSGQSALLAEELRVAALAATGEEDVRPNIVSDLSIDTATDEDWFEIELDHDGRPGDFIRIRFEYDLGDLALELRRKSDPGTIALRANGASDGEQISLAGVRKDTYLVRVNSTVAATNPDYALAVVINPLPTLSVDLRETPTRNDTSGAASDLRLAAGTQIIRGLSLDSTSDVDWFKFELGLGGRAGDYLRLDFDAAFGDIDLALYAIGNPTTPILSSTGTGNREEASLDALSAGIYLARVSSPTGTTNPDYKLTLSVSEGTITPDRFEANDTLQTATRLDAATNTRIDDLSIHPGDTDWIRFDMSATGRMGDVMQVAFDSSKGELAIAFFNASGTQLGFPVTRTSEGLSFNLLAITPGTYYLRVNGLNGATNRYTCNVIAAQAPPPNTGTETTEWTVMLYMTASDIEAAAFKDINELEELVANNLPPTVKLALFWDQSSATGRTTYKSGGGTQSATFTVGSSSDFNRGWEFSVAAPIQVTSLGFLDQARDGLAGSHEVGLWTNAGGLLASVTVPASTAAAPRGEDPFRYVSLTTPVTLAPGTYRIGAYYGPGAQDLFAYNVNPVGAAGHVSYVQGRVASGGGLRFPGGTSSLTGGFLGPNFQFRPVGPGAEGPRPAVAFPGWGDVGYAIVAPDTNPEVVRTGFVKQGEKNSGDPATLKAFVQWAKNAAPARKYALIMWDHGGGELGGSNFDIFDATPGDKLEVSEFLTCLGEVKSEAILRPATQKPFDLIAFDACLMGMLETAYNLKDYTGIYVASQENVPDNGFEYRNALLPLLTAPRLSTAVDLAAAMVNSYEGQYRQHSARWNTLSAVATDAVQPLLAELLLLDNAVTSASSTSTDWQAVEQARNAATFFKQPYYRDLAQYLQALSGSAARSAIRIAASNALAKLNGPGGAVIARTNEPRGCGGLSVYFPQMGVSAIDSSYASRNAAFFTATGWSGFLGSYISRTPTMTLASVSTSAGGRSALGADWAEENDSPSIATQLFDISGAGNLVQGLSLDSSLDVDWYRFTIKAAGNSSSQVLVNSSGTPAPALVVTLYGATDLTIPLAGPTTSAAISLSLNGRPAGEYLLRVTASSAGAVTDYRIQIDAPTTASGRADWASGNNAPIKAYDLGLVPGERLFAGLAVAPIVEDWFEFSTPRTGNNTEGALLVSPAQGTTAQLQVELRDRTADPSATGTVIKTMSGSTAMLMTYPADGAGTYRLRITSNAPGGGADVNYTLHFNPVNRGAAYGSADFQSWMASFAGLTASQRLLGVDADGDGRSNLMEYALGAHPNMSDTTGAPVVSFTTVGPNRHLTLEVPGSTRRWDVNYIVEVSSDLVTWYSDAANVITLPNAGTIVKARDNTPLVPGLKRYIRLRVVQP